MQGEYSRMDRVSKSRPCPICGRADWCLAAGDESAAICARIEEGSMKRCGEAGWLHILAEGKQPWRRTSLRLRIPAVRTPAKDFALLARRCRKQLESACLQGLAQSLGVSVESLRRLGVGWNGAGYTFPMRDEAMRIVGLHIRYPAGFKAAEKGSSNGLFVPDDLPADGTVLICEGPTDTAAALDLGFAAVGRPSCSAGGQMLKVLTKGLAVVIVGDNDPPKRRGQTPPGQKGAESLAQLLALHCRSVRIVYPPKGVKDLRQWKAVGVTPGELTAAIRATKPISVRVRAMSPAGKGGTNHGR
jgi:hypothetical protein